MIEYFTNMDDYTRQVLLGLSGIAAVCTLLCIKIDREAAQMPVVPQDEIDRAKAKNANGPRYFDKLDHKDPIEPTEELRESYQADKGNLQATEATMAEFISIQNIYDLPTPRGANGHEQHADMLCAAIDEQAKRRAARLAIDALHPAGRRV